MLFSFVHFQNYDNFKMKPHSASILRFCISSMFKLSHSFGFLYVSNHGCHVDGLTRGLFATFISLTSSHVGTGLVLLSPGFSPDREIPTQLLCLERNRSLKLGQLGSNTVQSFGVGRGRGLALDSFVVRRGRRRGRGADVLGKLLDHFERRY